MADSRSLARTLPTRTTRTRPHYREPDTDSDIESEAPPRTASSRPSRSTQRIRTYREDSNDDQEDLHATSPNTTEDEVEQVKSVRPARITAKPTRPPSRVLRKRTRSHVHRNTQSQPLDNFKRRKVGHPRPVNVKKIEVFQNVSIPHNGIIPPWQTLPYELLVKIIKYAAYPLCSTNGVRTPSTQWLLNTSKLCKSFNDAGTTALMYCPPLLPADHARDLIKMLSSDEETLTLNYSKRVRVLQVEVRDLLVRKSGIRLEPLLRCSPLLVELRIFHAYDSMIGKALWANPAHTREKWSYGGVFDILDECKIKLEVFEWNGRFQDTIPSMLKAHTLPCMQVLTKLTIVNLVFAEKHEEDRIRVRDSVVSALSCLPTLQALTFRNCNILDDVAMAKLPSGLHTLEIFSCSSLTSGGLQTYLGIGGISLTGLFLGANQVMALGFLSDLENVCPNLQHLHIDLNYEDCTSYNDREPLFDELLPNGRPTWPTNLQSIVIGPLRSLSNDEAEDFYTSLISKAASFKYLRILSLKTLLKAASWRDRAKLRSKWIPLFDRVFLTKKTYVPKLPKPAALPSTSVSKKLPRKSARLIELGETSVSESADESEAAVSELFDGPLPRQNACNVVEFELSDQRPAKDQYTEQDFLDDELAGDGEYNE